MLRKAQLPRSGGTEDPHALGGVPRQPVFPAGVDVALDISMPVGSDADLANRGARIALCCALLLRHDPGDRHVVAPFRALFAIEHSQLRQAHSLRREAETFKL